MFGWEKDKRVKARSRLAWLVRAALLGFLIPNTVVAQTLMEFEVPLMVNKSFIGNIDARIFDFGEAKEVSAADAKPLDEQQAGAANRTPRVEIPIDRFKELVMDFANQDQLDQWFQESSEETLYASIADLQSRGLEIVFDASMLAINTKIPRLGTQQVSVRGRGKPSLDDHFLQSPFASGLSFSLRNRYNHSAATSLEKGFDDLNIDFSGFTTIGGFGGWSLFYEADFVEDDAREFERKDVTLIHDNFDRGLRYSAGDIRPTVSRFQSSTDILGFSLERNYTDINPFRNLRPSGRSSFTLERESSVDFEVNGIIVSTEILQPGTYSIQDFPLAVGANDIRVWVDDGFSRAEVASFSTYVDTTLLAEGITNFGVSAGVQRERGTGRGRSYDDEPAIMGFYERGVRENLTLGAQVEARNDHALLSSNAIYGTRFGVFALQAAVSKRDDHNTGVASLLGYKYQGFTRTNWSIQSDFQASYRSDSFFSLGESVERPSEWSLNARTSFAKNGVNLTLGGESRTIDEIETQRLSASVSKSFYGFAISVGYQYLESERGDGTSDNIFNLSISKRIGDSRLRTQYKSEPRESRVEWRTRASRNVGDVYAKVSGVSKEDSDNGELDLSYINSRFELDMRHDTSVDKPSSDTNFSTTNIAVSGGFAYASGTFAFGRPFTRGFMVVDRHKNLSGKKVLVSRNSSDGDTIATSKRLGTTLVPLNNNYRTQRFIFTIDDLPLGYDIGSGAVDLFPGNLAGFKVDLGSEAANTVIGKILAPNNEPLSLESGRLIPHTGGESIIVFTNRTGRFFAEKMSHGTYSLVFGDEDQWGAEIEIEESDEPGLVQVGTIRLEVIK